MYSLLETNQDIEQFLKSIYRYIQLGVYIRGYQDPKTKSFKREIAEVTEFYVDEDNNAIYNTIYKKSSTGKIIKKAPSKYLIDYLDSQGVTLDPNIIVPTEDKDSEKGNLDVASENQAENLDLFTENKQEENLFEETKNNEQSEEVLFM